MSGRHIFLSTPSARRATRVTVELYFAGDDFYPRPPRGGRRSAASSLGASLEFLSTPSARRATDILQFLLVILSISIHALREEGDSKNRDKISIFL